MSGQVEAPSGHRESEAWEANYFRTRRNLALRRRRLGYFGFRPDERIVEIGCGDGLNLRLLREAGCTRVLGSDISITLLEHVRTAPVFVGDIYALPLREGAADAVLIDSVLHHLLPLEPSLRELHRVLRSGGRLCVLEPRPTLLRTLMDRAMDLVPFPPPLRARQLTYFEEREQYLAWLRYFPSLAGDLRAAGFETEMARRLPFGIALACRRRAER
jgi:SAM-dependent methyltransferase